MSATTTEAAQSIDPSNVVNVERYGAKGDLVADDYAAFARAIASGARGIRAAGRYLINTTIALGNQQVLFGNPKTNVVEAVPVGATVPRIKYRGAANTVAIKNATASLAQTCGVQDLLIDMNDNGSTAIQFATNYANFVRNVQFTGTMRIGLLSEDSYACDYDGLVFNGASVRTANVFLGQSNACHISRIHTSGYPETVGECLYGIAIAGGAGGGNGNTIRDCVLQGNTIGVASGSGVLGLNITGIYFENTLCNMRLGNFTSIQGVINVNGGTFCVPTASHTQYASRGPCIILSCNTATFNGPSFVFTAANGSAVGPWPFVVESCNALTIVDPYHFGASATTKARDLIYRYAAASNTGITIVGSDYGNHHETELILKDSASYGSVCAGIRVSGTTVSATAYQPAIISGGALAAILKVDLPTGASLVI